MKTAQDYYYKHLRKINKGLRKHKQSLKDKILNWLRG